MVRIASYLRKSVYSDKSDSIQAQYTLISDYCNSHYTDFELYRYEDEGFTGANTNRPAFQKLTSDISERKIDILICYKIDRVSRDVKDFSNFFSFLQENKVEFVSIKEQIDTSTPLGRAMMYICSVFAQMERETIAQRVKDSLLELSKSGKWAGGRAPLGYRRERVVEMNGKNHTVLVPDPDGIQLLNLISDKFLEQNMTIVKLDGYCRKNNIKTATGSYFSSSQLWNVLKNPTYCTADSAAYDYFESLGCTMAVDRDRFDGLHAIMPYNRTRGGKTKKHVVNPINEWIISVGLHKPIFTSEKYIAIQSKFGQNVIDKTRKHKVGILHGIVKCSCGWNMRAKHKVDKVTGKIYDDYFCSQRQKRGRESCSMPSVHIETLDSAVIDLLKQIKLDKKMIDNYCFDDTSISIHRRNRADVQRDIGRIENKILNLTNTLSNTSGSTAAKYIVTEIEKLDRELSGYKYELMEIGADEKKHAHFQHTKEYKYKMVCDIVDKMDELDYDELQILLKELFKECMWDGETLHVKL